MMLIKLIAKVLHQIHKNNGEGMPIFQKDSMKNSIKWAPYLSDGEKNIIFKYIDNLPEKDCLCHGDPNPGNIILKNGVPVIIDWMDATRGNPAADAAELITIYKYAVLSPETPEKIIEAFNSSREILCNTFVDEYTRLSGISYEEIKAWILPIAAAKLATGSRSDEEKAMLLEVVRKKLSKNK
jgi:thiamine kinase-like enzyme